MIYAQQQPELNTIERKTNWMDIAQVVVSILVFVTFFLISASSFVIAIMPHYSPELKELDSSLWVIASGFLVLAIVSLISVITAGKTLSNKKQVSPIRERGKFFYWILILLPLLIAAGYLAFRTNNLPSFVLPLLTVLAFSVAILWILKLGIQDEWAVTRKRNTGLFTFSMSFGISYIMILQLLVFVFMFGIIALLVMQNPEGLELIRQFAQNLGNPELLTEQVAEQLLIPSMVLVIILVFSLFAPMIEEIFKTMGVWFLNGRKITPREGWIAGLVSGAAFGLIEAFLYSAQGMLTANFAEWLFFVLGRIGGLLLHTFTGGITGWGLAKSWRKKRAGPAIGAYVMAILIHGLWNFVAIGQLSIGILFDVFLSDTVIYVILGFLLIAMLIAYIGLRRRIWREDLENVFVPVQILPIEPLDDLPSSAEGL